MIYNNRIYKQELAALREILFILSEKTFVYYSTDKVKHNTIFSVGRYVQSQLLMRQSGFAASRINLSPFTKDFRAVGQHYRHLYFSLVLLRGHLILRTKGATLQTFIFFLSPPNRAFNFKN